MNTRRPYEPPVPYGAGDRYPLLQIERMPFHIARAACKLDQDLALVGLTALCYPTPNGQDN